MAKQTFTLNDFSGGINNIKDSRDISINECAKIVNLMVDRQGAIRTAGELTAYPNSGDTENLSGDSSDNQPGNGLFYFESDYGSKATSNSTGNDGSGNWASIYAESGLNQFAQASSSVYAAYDVGDKISITGTTPDRDGVYTIIGKKDNGGGVSAIQRYGFDILEDLGSTVAITSETTITSYEQYGANFWLKPVDSNGTTAANLEIAKWDSENESWSNADNIQPITSDQYISGVFKPVYYSADNAVRVSDSNFKNGSKIRWHGFIERDHPDQIYLGWYTKDNDLLAPTAGDDVRLGNTYPDTAGVGLHWYILHPVDTSSTWESDTYETGMTFIYDENQESKITEMQSSYIDFTPADGDSVTIKALMFTPYNPRISAARLYYRISGSDDEWSFLAEAHFTKGIRASLDSDFTSGWTVASSNQYYSSTVTSINQNLDTYETLNGWPSSTKAISLGKIGELWKSAVVCNRRVFLANVKVRNEGSGSEDSKHYGDRIMYSEAGKFDTFPSFNFIDVVKGDSEEYVSIVEYGDRLLAFKQKTLFVINVSSPSPSGWFLEKTFKHNGIQHKEAVFRSEDGVVWVNSAGCWLYNGSNIVNLVENKLDTVNATNTNTEHGLSWKDFYDNNSIVGYAPKYKQIIILQDCEGSTDPNNTLIYDFRTRSWVQNSDQTTFFNNVVYSNFVLDGNGDLAIMTTGGVIRYYNPVQSQSTSGIELITKFIDFGNPYNLKKVYKIIVSYKSRVDQADPIECRYIDSSGDMQSFADVDGSVDFAANTTEWNVASFTCSSPITCQSIQIKVNPPNATSIEINEIMIDYRLLHKRVS